MVDAAEVVADDAGVVAAVLHDRVVEPEAPLVGDDGAEATPGLLAVLQPGDVGRRLADGRTLEPQRVARWLDLRVRQHVPERRSKVLLLRRVRLGLGREVLLRGLQV